MARRKVDREIIDRIKSDIKDNLGEKVKIKANKGRRKVEEREGVLEETYPNLFVIQLDEDNNNRCISFTYSDVLTEIVEVTVLDEEEPQRLEYEIS